MPHYESESDDYETTPRVKLFGRERPMRDILGGGRVADILLWKNRNVSAALLIGVAIIWFLFEVVEYNFVTLFCHITITAMLVIFIWCICARHFGWDTPKIPKLLADERAFNEVVSNLLWRLNQFLKNFLRIAGGEEPVHFFLVIISLYILSVIGSYFDFVNLLFIGFLFLETMPYLYMQYEKEVDYHAAQMTRKMNKMYRRFDSRVLNKIPRGPKKEKKHT
ncbi:Reticulon [Corchorus capsularis]|uniref:Reticulon-like protein n=1 Tax=Corchorus capsularis TaxID=210143 RepID=A0A1R3GH65_COCAP|nr:Reticulon [Corchorus capsularis]